MMNAKMTLSLDPTLKERVDQFARDHESSSDEVVREAIERFLDRGHMLEQGLNEAEEAYRHYKETGLRLTAEEANAWLTKLAHGEDCDPPECHV